MGVDVVTIIPHRLPVGNLAQTAAAIAAALQVQITYGYENADWDFVAQGTVGEGSSFTLMDTTVCNQEKEDLPGAVCLELIRSSPAEAQSQTYNSCYIYRHCMECGTYSEYRWWNFERSVFDKEQQGYLTGYRLAIQQEAAPWGAAEALHYPDSFTDKATFLHSDKEWMRWEDLLEKTKLILGGEPINISGAMRAGSPHPNPDGPTVEAFYEDFLFMPLRPDATDWHCNYAASAAFVEQTVEQATADIEALTNPLSLKERHFWYEHLVDQSVNDGIYDLIHEHIDADFQLNHRGDFVVLRVGHLPAKMQLQVAAHVSQNIPSEEYCFRTAAPDYVVLHNDKLRPYLKAAKRIEMIEDRRGRRFLELFFEFATSSGAVSFPPEEVKIMQPDINSPAEGTRELFGKEEALAACWKAIIAGTHKELALEYAEGSMAFLQNAIDNLMRNHRQEILSAEDFGQALYRIYVGFNIPAVAFAWNNLPEEARRADSFYLHNEVLWESLKSVIPPYLEMLIAKGWTDYLAWVFSVKPFREFFMPYYEAYISLLINNKYPLTRLKEVVPILNRVNAARKQYA